MMSAWDILELRAQWMPVTNQKTTGPCNRATLDSSPPSLSISLPCERHILYGGDEQRMLDLGTVSSGGSGGNLDG